MYKSKRHRSTRAATVAGVLLMVMSAAVFAVKYQPSTSIQPAQSDLLNLYLADYYACTYGHFKPACDHLDTSPVHQAAASEGGLLDFYACTRGRVRSACAALYDNPYMALEPAAGGLPDFYACTRGHLQVACDALSGRRPTP